MKRGSRRINKMRRQATGNGNGVVWYLRKTILLLVLLQDLQWFSSLSVRLYSYLYYSLPYRTEEKRKMSSVSNVKIHMTLCIFVYWYIYTVYIHIQKIHTVELVKTRDNLKSTMKSKSKFSTINEQISPFALIIFLYIFVISFSFFRLSLLILHFFERTNVSKRKTYKKKYRIFFFFLFLKSYTLRCK